MRIHLLRGRPSSQQLQDLLEAQGGYIKLAVDIARGVLAGGGEYHTDCEEILLEDGSRQEDIWGADWYPESGVVTFGALINIRPRRQIEAWRSKIRLYGLALKRSFGAYLRRREHERQKTMRDLARLRERFLRDSPERRLGNLASDLLRLSTWLRMRRDEGAGDLMREIAWMIEWTGDHATEELVNIQRELCRWRRIWPSDSVRSLLAFRARQMSNRVLGMSGLTESLELDAGLKQVGEIGNVP